MPKNIERLEKENWRSLHNLAMSMYLDGQCYEFAAALHKGLGWPIMGLMTANPGGAIIRHAVVMPRESVYWDVRGYMKKGKIGRPFDIIGEPILKAITVEDMRKVRPVTDEAIERASLFAEALWPNLPWLGHTLQSRVLSFMDDLTNLCIKHGVWIRAPYPAAQPVLSQACGDEKGFKLSPTMDGQYFLDRVF